MAVVGCAAVGLAAINALCVGWVYLAAASYQNLVCWFCMQLFYMMVYLCHVLKRLNVWLYWAIIFSHQKQCQ